MPGITQRAVHIGKRAARWRFRGVLALAVIAPVIALTAAIAPSPRPSPPRPPGGPGGPGGARHGPGPAIGLVDRLQ